MWSMDAGPTCTSQMNDNPPDDWALRACLLYAFSRAKIPPDYVVHRVSIVGRNVEIQRRSGLHIITSSHYVPRSLNLGYDFKRVLKGPELSALFDQ